MTELSPEARNPQPNFETLNDYESWVIQDWLYERGTDNAQLHVRGKLKEESHEIADALRNGKSEDILDELGDFLWTASANALNVDISLEQCLRREISADLLGEGAVTPELIDELSLRLIPEENADVMAGWLSYLGHYLGKASKQWRNLRGSIDHDAQPQNFSEAWTLLKRARTYDGLAQSILVTSAVAQRFGGKSLHDVMVHNARKLETRKLNGEPVTSVTK